MTWQVIISLEREYGSEGEPTGEPSNSAVTSFLTLGHKVWVKVKPTLIYGKNEIDLSDYTINWDWLELSYDEDDENNKTYHVI